LIYDHLWIGYMHQHSLSRLNHGPFICTCAFVKYLCAQGSSFASWPISTCVHLWLGFVHESCKLKFWIQLLTCVSFCICYGICRNRTLAKCEDETHTPKVGDLKSFGTPENSELDCRGQNTLHWGVLDIIGKVLKCRCPKWPRLSHLDICSSSYGQKNGRESNLQFDSRPLKVGNRPDPDVRWGSATWRWKALKKSYKIGLDLVPIGG
jgi:hypothetical protein